MTPQKLISQYTGRIAIKNGEIEANREKLAALRAKYANPYNFIRDEDYAELVAERQKLNAVRQAYMQIIADLEELD